MPMSNFNVFIANYWTAIAWKKIRFCIPKTMMNFWILWVLRDDGYIWSFKNYNNLYIIDSTNIEFLISLHKIIAFSKASWLKFISFKQLIILTKRGGYFILSTRYGILNDSAARAKQIGGILLFAIF
jgi:ribosomal protein S8